MCSLNFDVLKLNKQTFIVYDVMQFRLVSIFSVFLNCSFELIHQMLNCIRKWNQKLILFSRPFSFVSFFISICCSFWLWYHVECAVRGVQACWLRRMNSKRKIQFMNETNIDINTCKLYRAQTFFPICIQTKTVSLCDFWSCLKSMRGMVMMEDVTFGLFSKIVLLTRLTFYFI